MQRTQRFDTLDGLRERVRAEFGDSARVIGIERVSKGGLAAVLGRGGQTPYYEATIEVPDGVGPDGAVAELELTVADRVGIAALLAEANAADESTLLPADDPATTSAEFDALISQLREHAGLSPEPSVQPSSQPRQVPVQDPSRQQAPPSAQAEIRRPVTVVRPAPDVDEQVRAGRHVTGPSPVTGSNDDRAATDSTRAAAIRFPTLPAPEPSKLVAAGVPVPVPTVAAESGDLVIVAGYPETVVAGATRVAAGLRARLHPAGRVQLEGADPIDGRRAAIAARWNAVNDDAVVVVALGLEPGDPVEELVRAINPDQIWLHIAAGSRPADVRTLMAPLAAAASITALSVFGVARTVDPAALNALGVPVGLVDGERASSARL